MIGTASPVVRVDGLTKRYGKVTAIDDVSFSVHANKIYGLLGRNGAGKTTIMQLLTGQQFATSGTVQVFGESPVENARVLQQVCFIKESQKYPDSFRADHVLASAPWFFANWDAAFADRLIEDFRLPLNRPIKKLSRGQLSAVGVIVGLASRAPLTFFDEPYLGLDAVARQIFYDRLLEDYTEHPRTVILSTHLIDEVSSLLEHVLVVDEGRILMDQDADDLRGSASTVVGKRTDVDAFVAGRDIISRDGIGGLASVTVTGLTESEQHVARAAGLELSPVSLQQLIVQCTTSRAGAGTGTADFRGSGRTDTTSRTIGAETDNTSKTDAWSTRA
ncbi:ABC transporter ATP-binding protein [Cryobacterium melibiosiphilum]|uniref:ABC transporter ATP-binding protein n=1 Tax=Cryobacterium melibiosiphilum TaxID=995039 RepID=A0A3A5MTN9_9MICO|nr:ABC transporter ATP-binding protein [Cryobacterium melibiosiphilum]RJT89336.1 ABC transporter ATP-binding protein [Cryobacterium melibiosiphilum]